MKADERRAKLIVFVRVGLFAVGMALSAVALIKIRLQLIDTLNTKRELESRESKIADLKRSNDELDALGSTRAKHHAQALKNVEFVTRFYQLCRESSDLPLLKTDFVIYQSAVHSAVYSAVQGDLYAFSVPSGNHTLQLSVEPSSQAGMGAGIPPKSVKFPLLPSSGYFLRIYTAIEDESGKSNVYVELNSNNAAFTSVRSAVPLSISKPFDFPADEHLSPMRFDLRKMQDIRGDFKNLTYPNCLTHLGGYSSDFRQGLQLVSYYWKSSSTTPMYIRLRIISDSEPCIASLSLMFSGVARDRLAPYTGNGRIYVRP